MLPGQGFTDGDCSTPGSVMNARFGSVFGVPGNGYVPKQCFVAKTAVRTTDGLQAIAKIRVGQVLEGAAKEKTLTSGEWRCLELRAVKADGSRADLVLLRPLAWLKKHDVQIEKEIAIEIPGCGFMGLAEVRTIQPCPSIKNATGPIVSGTIRQTAVWVVDLWVDGVKEPIGTTANHRFWSEDRQQFIRADQLIPGERLRGTSSYPRVIRTQTRRTAEPVYNLEMHGQTSFTVSPLGIVVQDAGSSAK